MIFFCRVLTCALVPLVVLWTLSSVPLIPEVNRNFFFASDDPQLAADKQIQDAFGGQELVIIAITGPLRSPTYLQKTQQLSAALLQLPAVYSVRSLSHGPDDLEDATESPLWSRLLISPGRDAANIVLSVQAENFSSFIPEIIQIAERFDSPSFQIHISGIPYLIERIGQLLLDDLQTFTLSASALLLLLGILCFRSILLVSGMALTAGLAASATLLTIHFLNIQLGVLTANLISIVFVLTMSHMVFLTFAASRIADTRSTGGSPRPLLRQAWRETVHPSLWSMVTTCLGFGTYIFTDAKPLQEFGVTGVAAGCWSFLCAFSVFPAYLGSHANRVRRMNVQFVQRLLEARSVRVLVVGIMLLAAGGAFLLPSLKTDPSLLSYFDDDSELYRGLRYVDVSGGSSPLRLVIYDAGKERFTTSEVFDRAWALQRELESLEHVGSVLSLPLILAEANRYALSRLLTWDLLLDVVESQGARQQVAHFLTGDRKFALFVLRMIESDRTASRAEILANVKAAVARHGFKTHKVGGIFSLQKQMGRLIYDSLISSLLISVPLFFICAYILSRSLTSSFAVVIAFSVAPLLLLGVSSFLGIALDLVSVPSATLAAALGVDVMFHLIHEKQIHGRYSSWTVQAANMATPIVSSTLVIGIGFSVLLLSNFPPSVRFGGFVTAGVALAAFSALVILPVIAGAFDSRKAPPSVAVEEV